MSPREWLRHEIEDLIAVYKTRPELWDVNSRFYKDRSRRLKSINELAMIFDTTSEEISRKIHNLRNQFNSEMKKIKSKSRKGEEYKSTWYYLDSMMFLKESVLPRPKLCEMHSENSMTCSNDVFQVEKEEEIVDVNEGEILIEEEKFVPFQEENDQKHGLDLETESEKKKKKMANEEWDLFGQLVTATLKNMPPERAIRCQDKIFSLLTQERLAILTNNDADAASSDSPPATP